MILILAGTKDAREIIKILHDYNRDILASVVTEYGYEILKGSGVELIRDRLNRSEMEDLINERGIKTILDATHPFAREVSENAIKACKNTGIKYIRFEREKLNYNVEPMEGNLIRVKNYQDAALKAKQFNRILLTIGSKKLDVFVNTIDNWQDRLIARILPDTIFIERARELGFLPANIIAMQGPYTEELNHVLIKDYKINVLVTKASGKTGGLDTKIKAAFNLNIPVILIDRPEMNYEFIINKYKQLTTMLKEGKI